MFKRAFKSVPVFWKYKAETTDIKVKSDWQGYVSHDIAIESHRPTQSHTVTQIGFIWSDLIKPFSRGLF